MPFNSAVLISTESHVRGLSELLASINLSDYLVDAQKWCEREGAESVEDLAGYETQFVEHLNLKSIPKKKLLDALQSRTSASRRLSEKAATAQAAAENAAAEKEAEVLRAALLCRSFHRAAAASFLLLLGALGYALLGSRMLHSPAPVPSAQRLCEARLPTSFDGFPIPARASIGELRDQPIPLLRTLTHRDVSPPPLLPPPAEKAAAEKASAEKAAVEEAAAEEAAAEEAAAEKAAARPSAAALANFYRKVGIWDEQSVRGAASLDWSYKQLNAGDCQVIAYLIASGALANLTKLSLRGNQIGDEGIKAFSTALASGALAKLTDFYIDDKHMKNPHLVAACKLRGINIKSW